MLKCFARMQKGCRFVSSMQRSNDIKTKKMEKLTRVEQKYLNFLFDVEKRCKSGIEFTIRHVIIEHKINRSIGVILKEKGIIKKVGSQKKALYVWKTIRPNINMTKGILDAIREYQRGHESMRPKKQQKTETIRVEPRIHPKIESVKPQRGGARIGAGRKRLSEEIKSLPTQKSVVILWGLINIKF